MNELKVLSYDLRKHVLDMIVAGKGGHIGGDMSVMEILVELYMKQMIYAFFIKKKHIVMDLIYLIEFRTLFLKYLGK